MDQTYARENIRVVAVIQARMGSTRLPGKVLKPIAGKPLLWHIVHRLKACHLLEDIAVATSVNPADEAIVVPALDAVRKAASVQFAVEH